MSTCPHCNEVQPCNLYIKCTLCPFIAWRELKVSWCFGFWRSLVFWGGAVELLVAILNPNWQRQDRKGGIQSGRSQICKQFSSNLYCLNRTCVSTQSNKQCESKGVEQLPFDAFCSGRWWHFITFFEWMNAMYLNTKPSHIPISWIMPRDCLKYNMN